MKRRAKPRTQPKPLKEQEKQGQRTISSYFKTSSENENISVAALDAPDPPPTVSTGSTPKRPAKSANNKKSEKISPPKHTPKRLSMLERWVIQKVGIVPEAARSGVFEEEIDLDLGSSEEEATPTSFKKAKLGYFSFSPAVNFYKQFEHSTAEELKCADSPVKDMFLSLIDEPIDFTRDVSPPFTLSQVSELTEDTSKAEELEDVHTEVVGTTLTDQSS